MNGQRTNWSEAPTRRMISISCARDMTAIRMELTTMSSTVSPTRASTPNPTARSVAVTLTSLSMSFCCSTTLATTGPRWASRMLMTWPDWRGSRNLTDSWFGKGLRM